MVVDCVSVKVEPTLAFGKYRYLCAVGYRPTCLLYMLVQHWCYVGIRYQCCNYDRANYDTVRMKAPHPVTVPPCKKVNLTQQGQEIGKS